ncbi:MAG: hypothetical protein PHE54_03900 [Bacilli bacterium]|nr:hypothetical protein [Bacilli bacterium]
MILSIIDSLDNLIKPFRDFVFENYSNPFMWLGFLIIGILLFYILYNVLQKEK